MMVVDCSCPSRSSSRHNHIACCMAAGHVFGLAARSCNNWLPFRTPGYHAASQIEGVPRGGMSTVNTAGIIRICIASKDRLPLSSKDKHIVLRTEMS